MAAHTCAMESNYEMRLAFTLCIPAKLLLAQLQPIPVGYLGVDRLL